MVRHSFVPAATLGLASTAFAADRSFDRTLTVNSSPAVSVATGSGDIDIHQGYAAAGLSKCSPKGLFLLV